MISSENAKYLHVNESLLKRDIVKSLIAIFTHVYALSKSAKFNSPSKIISSEKKKVVALVKRLFN